MQRSNDSSRSSNSSRCVLTLQEHNQGLPQVVKSGLFSEPWVADGLESSWIT